MGALLPSKPTTRLGGASILGLTFETLKTLI